MENISLPFGASWLLVPGTQAAWGARLIYPDDLFGIDREQRGIKISLRRLWSG